MWYKTKTILQKNNLTEQRKNITDKTRMSPDPQQQKKRTMSKADRLPLFSCEKAAKEHKTVTLEKGGLKKWRPAVPLQRALKPHYFDLHR